jgi:4-amino-4-deoxy-L-arabinose transferase-like glycosyltransferase
MFLVTDIKIGFGIAGLLTFLVAGYLGIARRDYRRALRISTFVVLWLAAVLLDGWDNVLIMAIAMVTLSCVWFLMQTNDGHSPQSTK